MADRERADVEALREIEGLHPELWERLVPELRRIADRMASKDRPVQAWTFLTNHIATVREAANSIEALRAALASPPDSEPLGERVEGSVSQVVADPQPSGDTDDLSEMGEMLPERHPDCPHETGECRWPNCVPCTASGDTRSAGREPLTVPNLEDLPTPTDFPPTLAPTPDETERGEEVEALAQEMFKTEDTPARWESLTERGREPYRRLAGVAFARLRATAERGEDAWDRDRQWARVLSDARIRGDLSPEAHDRILRDVAASHPSGEGYLNEEIARVESQMRAALDLERDEAHPVSTAVLTRWLNLVVDVGTKLDRDPSGEGETERTVWKTEALGDGGTTGPGIAVRLAGVEHTLPLAQWVRIATRIYALANLSPPSPPSEPEGETEHG